MGQFSEWVRQHSVGSNPTGIEQIIEEGLPALLGVLFALDGAPIPYAALLESTQQIVRAGVPTNTYRTDDRTDQMTANSFRGLWEMFELVGVVECADFARDDGSDPFETPSLAGQDMAERIVVPVASIRYPASPTLGLRLTQLGQLVVAPYLAAVGMEIPVIGILADAPLSELFGHVRDWHRSRIEAEFDHWVAIHGKDEAIDELTEFATTADNVDQRVAAVELAGRLGDRSEVAVRGLIATKARRHARAWLLTHGFEQPNDETMFEAMLASFELLSLQCTGDPDDDEEVRSFLVLVFENTPAADLMGLLGRVDEPWAGDVLDVVGRLHDDQAIAKQAHKAALEHRTHLASLQK